MAADVGSTLLLLWGAGTNVSALRYVGLASLALAPPINHFVRRHPGRALVSLALRAATLSASYAFFWEIEHGGWCAGETGPKDSCGWGIGLALALPLAAIIVDDAWLARGPAGTNGAEENDADDARLARGPTPVPAPPRVRLSPALSARPGSAFLSIGATF